MQKSIPEKHDISGKFNQKWDGTLHCFYGFSIIFGKDRFSGIVLKPYVSCSRIGVPEDSPIHTAINIQRKSDTKSMPEKGMQNDGKMRENGAQMGAKIH